MVKTWKTQNQKNSKVKWRNQKKILKKVIIEYVRRIKYTIITKDVTNHANSLLNMEYSTGFFKNFMKNPFNLSLKRLSQNQIILILIKLMQFELCSPLN